MANEIDQELIRFITSKRPDVSNMAMIKLKLYRERFYTVLTNPQPVDMNFVRVRQLVNSTTLVMLSSHFSLISEDKCPRGAVLCSEDVAMQPPPLPHALPRAPRSPPHLLPYARTHARTHTAICASIPVAVLKSTRSFICDA